MSSLRSEIRAILQQELAAMRVDKEPAVESVRIDSSADLNHFVNDLLARVKSSDFVEQVSNGLLRFELAPTIPASTFAASSASAAQTRIGQPLIASPAPVPAPPIDKKLLTEKDIAALDVNTRNLHIAKQTRLTPLARDEVNRRGIRIQRVEQ